ncbi:MAG: DUF3592 domain-containing protein [Pirellulales bacterium]
MKKRGNRRTGSAAAAQVGEAAMFGALLIVGAVGLWAVLSWWIVPHWQADYDFVETVGTIVDAKIDESAGISMEKPHYRASFLVEYEFDGVTRRVWTLSASNDYARDRETAERGLERFTVGGRYACWFAPRDPQRVVLQRGGNWWIWLLLVIPIPFITIGVGGLIYTTVHWRTSNERRAAQRQGKTLGPQGSPEGRTGDEADDATGDGAGDGQRSKVLALASVPLAENMTNSPGTHLAYRLPMSSESSWRLLGAMLFCVLSAGVAVACGWLAVAAHMQGDPDWLLDLSILPLAGVTVWAVSLVAQQWTISNAVGPTMVEIADHPLFPGETYELMVLQSGRLAVVWLEVSLVCVEQASYQQGTDVRTETAMVWRERVLRCERFRIDDGRPFQRKCLLGIPAGAMHSLCGPSNEIRWSIVVRGEAETWPAFERSFPIVVYPVEAQPLVRRSAANVRAGSASSTAVAATREGGPA